MKEFKKRYFEDSLFFGFFCSIFSWSSSETFGGAEVSDDDQLKTKLEIQKN